jgi:hypothetical protein
MVDEKYFGYLPCGTVYDQLQTKQGLRVSPHFLFHPLPAGSAVGSVKTALPSILFTLISGSVAMAQPRK